MNTSHGSATGYTRLTCTQLGVGAAEQLRRACNLLLDTSKTEITGTVFTVFDSTISIDIDIESELSGSTVVTVAVPAVRPGPLIARVAVSERFSFLRSGYKENTACRFRLLERCQDMVLQLRVGKKLIIDIPRSTIQSSISSPDQSMVSLDVFTYDSTRYDVHSQLLDWTRKQNVDDGLNRLEQLHCISKRSAPLDTASPAVREELALLEPFVSCFFDTEDQVVNEFADVSTQQDTTQNVCSLLGNGPGSTPSGDDFLGGVMLILRRIDSPVVQSRLSAIGSDLVTSSQHRTTHLSTAFLAQAVAGRGAEPTTKCVDMLIEQNPDWDVVITKIERLLEIGHTSGADILAGMLTATTLLLPIVNTPNTDF